MSGNEISKLPAKSPSKELNANQGSFDLSVERQVEIDGIGMGVLKDGTAFLTGRGLARLVGIENLHIRTISQEWNDDPAKPRTARIKQLLEKRGIILEAAHIETSYGARATHAYPDAVCLAVLEYYAFDAAKPRDAARDNYRTLAGKALQDLIYSQVGYDPSKVEQDKFSKWHDRLALNNHSAPKGYFGVFTESGPIIYDMIVAGVPVDEKTIVDGSIGIHWSRFWQEQNLDIAYEGRVQYPHYYPDDHPQSAANPHMVWCYPMSSMGEFRTWLYDVYVGDGKMRKYLKDKAKRGDIAPSVAQLVIDAIEAPRLSA